MSAAGKPRAKSRKKLPKRKLPVPPLALSVDQFCSAYTLGKDKFYQLLRAGRGPKCMLLGRRRIITVVEAERWAERWQREQEAETAAA